MVVAGRSLRALLAGLLCSTGMIFVAHAQDATWVGGVSSEWVDGNNWNPASVPSGTATFGATGNTTVANSGFVSIGAVDFTAGAQAYTIGVDNFFIVNGTGIANNSSNTQTFNILDTTVALVFQNASTANGGTGAIIYNNAGFMYFQSTTSAGGSATTINNNEILQFSENSTAGSATIHNTIELDFFDSASAGSATITNSATGTITFNNSATASTASIDNSGGLQFNNQSTAGSAVITNELGGTIDFRNTGTAGGAQITNMSGGTITFHDTSTAGTTATIGNDGTVNFDDTSSAGSAGITTTAAVSFNNSATASSSHITVNAGGTLDFNNSSTAELATITNNSGTVAFNNLSLGGTAQITNDATLQFNNVADAQSATIVNNGAATFNNSATAGSAGITTNTGGQVSFNDSSTGGTASFVFNGTGSMIVNSTAMTAGSIASASGGSFIALNNSLTVGGNDTSTTYAGVVQGSGGLDKVGIGTLTLSNAANLYSGATTVDGGTLDVTGSIALSSLATVNTGATLTGTGAVGNTSIAAGGIFLPGNGTPGTSMSVNGTLDFASTATYTVNLNPTTASLANVTGTATLNGATVKAVFTPGSYIAKQYIILSAGSVSGTFGTINNVNLPSGFGDTLSTDATNVYLNLFLAPPVSPGGLNVNQQNVFNALTNSFNTAGSIPAVFGTLSANGLTQISGEAGAGFMQDALQAGNSFLNLMLNPYFEGSFGNGGSFAAVPYAEEPRAATDAFASLDRKPSPASRFGVWGGNYGGSGSINGNATTGTHDYSDRFYALAAGLDYRATPDSVVGFALAGGGSHWSLEQALGGGRSDMFQAGLYGKTHAGPAYFSGALAYSFHDVTTNRTVTVAGADALEAKFRANVFGGRAEGGYSFAAPLINVTPFGAVQAQWIELPAYGETAATGSAQFALHYADQTVYTTRTELGARFDRSYTVGQGVLTLYTRAAWAHDFNNTPVANANFQLLPASNFVVNAAKPDPDSALVSAGAEYKLADGWSLLAKFNGEFSETTALYTGSGMIKKVW